MPEEKINTNVFVIGAFDDIQTKDIRFLQEANQRFGNVHVQLLSDQTILASTGRLPKFKLDERQYYLESIRYVTQVNTTHQSIPVLSPEHYRDGAVPLWIITRDQADGKIGSYLLTHTGDFFVMPNPVLEGFPSWTKENESPASSKKVMVSGCFDWVHTGHIRFFEEASQFGDLYVVVGHDENLRLLKGEDHPLFPQEERRYWVQSIRFVKQAIISTGDGWLDAEPEVHRIKPDTFIVNQDGDRPEKQAFFETLGIEYKVLERKPKPGLPRRESTALRGF